jgi:hypothetical protein
MTEPTDAKNLDGYDTPLIPWERVQAVLDQEISQAPGTGGPDRHTCWLATIDPGGRPHVVGIGAHQVDGAWYFTSGPSARKSKNLTRDARCTISVALDDFDLVVEGSAERVTDGPTLERIVAIFAERGWPAEPRGDEVWAEFSAPSAGPPPWHLYRLVPERAVALATSEPGGATRWRF